MNVKSVRDADVAGKRVLLRVDYNVPLKDGAVADDSRIRATLPTIALLKEKGAAHIIIATHVGRPEGKVSPEWSTASIFDHLKTLVDTTNIEMLENLRFDAREESNEPTFAQELASKADVYVNDAFAASHRAHASIVGVANLLPSYAGLLVEKEIAKLSEALHPPQHPALVIFGGAKPETKLPLIEKLAPLYDKVLVGGALADKYKPTLPNIVLPQDGNPQFMGMLDIGPNARAEWVEEVKNAKFVLWNGPVGWYEKGYVEGTNALAEALVVSGVEAVIGGGDTAAALSKFNFDPEKVFISTGGGAALEFLASGTLPGIEVLKVS